MSIDQTHDEYVKEVETLASRLKEITHMTWDYEMTGGGCDALVTTESISGRYIMLTDSNAQIPLDTDDYCVGLYTNDEECEYLDFDNATSLIGIYHIISAWLVSGQIGKSPVCDIHCDESRMNKHGQCDECLDDAHEMEIMARG